MRHDDAVRSIARQIKRATLCLARAARRLDVRCEAIGMYELDRVGLLVLMTFVGDFLPLRGVVGRLDRDAPGGVRGAAEAGLLRSISWHRRCMKPAIIIEIASDPHVDPSLSNFVRSLARRSVFGPLMWTAPSSQGCFGSILIRSLASICPACWIALAYERWPRWFPRREFQTRRRPLRPEGSTEYLASRIDRSHHLLVTLQVLASAQHGCG